MAASNSDLNGSDVMDDFRSSGAGIFQSGELSKPDPMLGCGRFTDVEGEVGFVAPVQISSVIEIIFIDLDT
ncbi:hypothetical protein GCT19_40000 [Paraburkholderia sp. CNPSo 3155]|uniref:Uncharacterized protein n=1 Tax=Paraburkholderia atlantica TaxID=2654982 RepID=A0A6I1Q232_PARAM|nr:hypothetical protein [Paraburkholderia atlantica]MBB5429012.1 hypothetical protein [Paraburkholderia atlantica]MPW11566.1 hypothetical protein [Paraburkholderia atlantica]NUY35278.1 hypothetical protein [Paraburkholderia atlantica]